MIWRECDRALACEIEGGTDVIATQWPPSPGVFRICSLQRAYVHLFSDLHILKELEATRVSLQILEYLGLFVGS